MKRTGYETTLPPIPTPTVSANHPVREDCGCARCEGALDADAARWEQQRAIRESALKRAARRYLPTLTHAEELSEAQGRKEARRDATKARQVVVIADVRTQRVATVRAFETPLMRRTSATAHDAARLMVAADALLEALDLARGLPSTMPASAPHAPAARVTGRWDEALSIERARRHESERRRATQAAFDTLETLNLLDKLPRSTRGTTARQRLPQHGATIDDLRRKWGK